MPRISGFSDFARNLANHLVDRETPITTRVGTGELRSFLEITTEDERRIRATILGAIGDGYDFFQKNFERIIREEQDSATLTTFQVVAEEMGLSQEGTAKEVQDRIFAEFHRLKKALEDERKAGAKEERKRIEEMILRHKKGYEEQASECEEKARRLKAELEDVERMAEEHRRDVDAHQAVWSLVVIDDAVADGFSFESKGED